MSIENTQDPGSIELTSMLMLATGDPDTIIDGQERAGQAQLVHSDRLPTNLHSPREEFEAVGFTFGEPDPRDPMFAPATLPDGWKREGSDHAMWSYIVDQLGRRRASIFYKAAFYDRDAFMSLNTVSGYVWDCISNDDPIVTDDAWATRASIVEAARSRAESAGERVEEWQQIADRRGPSESSSKYIAQYTAERDKYLALASEYSV
ncbi:hypothetical protein ACIQCF_07540 [Streptomyces sp. NPDC088353]|uniref:hypothetical protein n=1 Tax=Streptomyces sp. NPDC088353 TaxID=3365855 RepID=UPI00381456F8